MASEPADETFTAEEAVVAQRDLRHAIGLKSEQFSLPAFVGMISDEIEQLRSAGRDDQYIANTIREAIGRDVSAKDIATYYATPDERRR